jgi:hypothetical protein
MSGQTIDAAAYHQFRAGLLKHIGMEEKILLPAAQRLRGGKDACRRSQTAPRSRRLDRVIGASAVTAGVRAVLKLHNPIEQDPTKWQKRRGTEAFLLKRKLLASLVMLLRSEQRMLSVTACARGERPLTIIPKRQRQLPEYNLFSSTKLFRM